MNRKTMLTRLAAILTIAMVLFAASPVDIAHATAATYNFQSYWGVTVAPGVVTNMLVNCNTYPTSTAITLMTTDAFNCPTEGVILSSVGTLLDVWNNTAYTADTKVTGTTLKIRLREHQLDAGPQSWTAGIMLMYVNASGTVTNFDGVEVTQPVGDNVNLDFTLNLSGQSATVPAGSKIGIRIRAVSSTSNAMRVYYGSTAGAAGGVSGELTVDEKPVTTLTVSSAIGTYGGTVNLSATLADSTATGIAGQTIAFSLNGSSVGTAVTNASGVASLSDVSLVGINASTYPAGVMASFAGGTGYVASNDSDSLTVNPKSLTITGVVANNKTYDRTATATLNLTGASLVGVVPPDSVSIDSSGASAVFASANAGTWTVTASGFGLSGAAGNYVLSAQPTVPNATINPKGLTITGVTASNKVYDRTNVAALNLGGATLVGVISPDAVTINSGSASAVFASANAGTWAVTVSGFGLNGAAGNYVLSAQPTVPNATITSKSLTITGVVANSKTYDRTTTATFNLTGASLVGVINPDPVSIDSSGASGTFASANAGTWAVTVSGFGLSGAAGNYVLSAQPTVPNATILTKAASVTPNAASKTYGDTDPALSGTLSGFLPADSVTATYSRIAGETVAGSPYTISATLSPSGVLGNYAITYNTANFTITPKGLTITM
jgi:trimeric autotransporter adhesin